MWRYILKNTFTWLLVFALLPFAGAAQQARYLVLISIDGLRPEFYMQASWNAVTLRKLMASGVYSDGVRSVFPSVTYPAHATLVTGALPARHGVYYNEPFAEGKSSGAWYWEEQWIKTPTLWDAVRKAGLTSAAIWWPVTAGGPIDHCMPEIWSTDKKEDKSIAVRKHTLPNGFFEELEQHATGKLGSDDFNSDFTEMDEKIGKAACYVIKRYKPNLLAVHFACVDHFQHVEGREGQNVRKAVENVDKAVAGILESIAAAGLKDSTTVIITGDHGFADIHTGIAPNVWLRQNGLINKDKTDWKAIFHTSGSAAFLHLRKKGDRNTIDKVRAILSALPDSTKRLFRIIERKELDKMGAAPDAVLAISPVAGITVSAAYDGSAVYSVKGGTHGYSPEEKQMRTGFIASGAGTGKGRVKAEMSIVDVAPIVVKLLHLDMKVTDGKLRPGILIKNGNQ